MQYKLVTDQLLDRLRRLVLGLYGQLGSNNGIATLGSDGLLSPAQRPAGSGGGTIVSVFGRTTAIITAQSGDYTFNQLASIPNTIAGYGITDGVTPSGTQTLINKTISGSSNTLSNIPESAVLNLTSDLAAKQGTLTLTTTGSSGAATLIGSTLNIPQYSGGGGGAVSSVFTRTGAVTAQSGDYTFSQIGSTPTSISGYGITDSTTQFMWVVGGANNFASLPGTPTPPAAAATTLVNSALTNVNIRMFRNGLAQMGLNPGNGNSFYTKTKSSNTVTFSALQTGDEIIIETLPL